MSRWISRYAHEHFRVNLNLKVQLAILLSLTGLVLYTVFFSTLPVVHDAFHAIRHALAIIPCH
jgi:cobalt transporter subunit CbtB